ncbi:16S rRNA processing protein RimM [Limimaricola variabilis]|jgi:16S rRNA processing protein RimM|uniref:Ribosome maturation factor RimM n=1 Tax=Limimaricola variabilis TaxID=1492771 RepID=A0ABR6HQ37_9RHOB|nr:ribosome maturation factor RimM [Limimaricola variabilis]MBB3712665.1 16S rRNA processing protein RimM [Limimaricola variabilis]WPY93418.1 ribosome maturation factor RimM [Limimaricola variabilis]
MGDLICVGRLAGAFGVRGEVRLKSFCADPEAIADYVPLLTKEGREFRQVVITGQATGAYTARLDGITTKEEADALKGADLFAPRDRLPALPDDEYYHADLIGLPVHDTGGALLGTVRAVLNHGAGDLLELLPPDGGATVLLPFTLAAVPTVDLGAGRIVADPPEGLFPG